MRKIRKYSFGYDVDNIRDVQHHVIDNYDADHYKITCAPGDDVMNHLTLYRADDEQLDQLIDSCSGLGSFED
jgi:hypothetical protein